MPIKQLVFVTFAIRLKFGVHEYMAITWCVAGRARGCMWVIPCQLTHLFPGPSPILIKFDRLDSHPERLTHTKFQLIIIIIEEATALQRFLKFIKMFDFNGTQMYFVGME